MGWQVMAYLLELSRTCEMYGCDKLATHQVFAYGNQPSGKLCKKHATKRVADLEEAESKNPAGFAR